MVKKNLVAQNLVVQDKKGNLKRVEFMEDSRSCKAEVKYKVLQHSQKHRIGQTYKTSLKKFAEFIHGIYVEGDKFSKNDIVELDGEKFRVLRNDGSKGLVRSLEKGFEIPTFWRAHNSRFIKTGTATP